MNAEFTGERVIPGRVDVDLWNEHFARYAFARRFAAGKRVLDSGCGAGYGSAELAADAASVTGIDIAAEAVSFAAASYGSARYVQASCADLPFGPAAFDLIVMYEVIEHVTEWQRVLSEARRVLAPGGRLIVSTPNKSFYAKTREQSGPNPFHEHEFEYAEFRDALSEVFPSVAIFLEDHAECVVFRPASASDEAQALLADTASKPEDSGFFIAICSDAPQTMPGPFVYVPRSANLLGEKLLHIERLEGEVRIKDGWIAQLQTDHQELLRQHEAQLAELQKANRYASSLADELNAHYQREIQQLSAGYEAQISALHATVEERTVWANETERRLTADLESCVADRDRQTQELAACVQALHRAEADLEERTRWALQLDEQRGRLEAALGAVRSSRWIRLGRAIGLGPELQGH